MTILAFKLIGKEPWGKILNLVNYDLFLIYFIDTQPVTHTGRAS